MGGAVRKESCQVNMTVLLSFEEKTNDARACAQSGHCPFKMSKFIAGHVTKMRFLKNYELPLS